MRGVHKRIKATIAAALCACLVVSGFLNVNTASALVLMYLNDKPAPISNTTTPTFTFEGYDMDMDEPYTGNTECKIDSGAFASCTSPFVTPPLTVGDHTFTVHAEGDSDPDATVVHSWNINQTPTLAGGASVSGIAGIPVAVADLQINDADNDVLGMTLSAPSGILELGTVAGITFTGSPTGSNITFSGTRTDLNSALASLTYTPSVAGVVDIDVKLTGASGGARETLNGHFYRVIDSAANWNAAKSAAEASTYGGVSGYLATVTSAAEKAYLQNRMSDGVWTGGSDTALEGDWRWLGGPENNTAFWSGGTGGSAVGGAYTNWQGGQPDNFSGNENCLEMRLNSSNSWNDENCSSSRRYIIEYGTDGALPSLDTAQVSATSLAASGDLDGDGVSNAMEAGAPNNGDANNDGTPDYTQTNVSSEYNAVSNSYAVMQTSCAANQQVQLSAESSSQKDPVYDYPYGLASFTATTCGTPGVTVLVTQYYFGTATLDALTLRKWNSTTGVYSAISDATLSATTIGGAEAIKVVYQVVDGGVLDQDGVANGAITDPVGLAEIVVTAPNTGLENLSIVQLFVYGSFGLSALVSGAYILRRYFV